jgi:hypothetical protein
MVLISIRPFALRKVFLVLLALLGFSALCFADPVLMARRYSRDHSQAAAALLERPLRLQLSEASAQISTGNTTAASEIAETPEPRSWLSFQTQPSQCAAEIFLALAGAPIFRPTTSTD